tara:strand:- start:199 stop:441 length:243 start_codon:yes stop_codon:yes gene_type:complete
MANVYYLKILLVFGGFALFFFFALKYIKRFQKHHFSGDILIVDKKVLTSTVSVMIVKVRNQELLVSVSAEGVSVLQQLSQ